MSNEMPREQYERAEKVLFQHWMDHVYNGRVVPNWMDDSSRFWYRRDLRLESGKGTEYIVVNPAEHSSTPAFDHERLAASLSVLLSKTLSPQHLKLDKIEFDRDSNSVRFKMDDRYWECNLSSYLCTLVQEPELKVAGHEVLSPDRQWVAYAEQYNIYVRHIMTGEIKQLTYDGELYYDYASRPEAATDVGGSTPRQIMWSPDSKKLLTVKNDQRYLKELHVVQNVPLDPNTQRPILHTSKYAYPGDEHVAEADVVVCDIEKKSSIIIKSPRVTADVNSIISLVIPLSAWSADSKEVYYLNLARDCKSAKLIIAQIDDGTARTAVEEQSDTFLFIDSYGYGNLDPYHFASGRPNFQLLLDGNVVWLSERDGYGHLYLFDGNTGQLVVQLTSGQWNVRRLVGIDEEQGVIYFTASGGGNTVDPYYQQLYRVSLTGSDLTLLTPEDSHHLITASPDLRYFVDTYSRVDQGPISVVYSGNGVLIDVLEAANIERLLEQGYQFPERFSVKARDGHTDLYGIMFKPKDFVPGQTYPIIDCFYGGPQLQVTPKSFQWDTAVFGTDITFGAQSLAQLGFVVIIMDGMGTPFRSKAFHDDAFENIEGAAGLNDHTLALRQLAECHPFIDLERVGIWGVSGGGYGSARAILQYPDVYKVAVSAAGNHDQRSYLVNWGERFQGAVDPNYPERYANQANAKLAPNLKGKLLLAHGDLDTNVHLNHTMGLVNALIQSNKDFDLLLLPNVGHEINNNPYFIRRKWDYFVRHLLEMEPPKQFEIGAAAKELIPVTSL
ncbi:DPP IV N-terminal domain-containing protein [Paenibacillus sp. L3-i20]|uniref:S9 family peptidase n=1 Tax=Paenibacillus sp. L3-i20 TaxID=2905833 RepID=UPI001EDD5610|nr:DPP IV N-terminal domain-containing protein [Paenibacillus sp. L3-i20]GKU77551.1 putative dipeptidyl peptidase IV [Paenibacillus sp. L3-i20]